MQRRFFLALGASVIAAAATPAFAETAEQQYVTQLRDQGFTKMKITHTWLGRTIIDTSNDKFNRELVFNSSTGEVLRDYWETNTPAEKTAPVELMDPDATYNGKSDKGKSESGKSESSKGESGKGNTADHGGGSGDSGSGGESGGSGGGGESGGSGGGESGGGESGGGESGGGG